MNCFNFPLYHFISINNIDIKHFDRGIFELKVLVELSFLKSSTEKSVVQNGVERKMLHPNSLLS